MNENPPLRKEKEVGKGKDVGVLRNMSAKTNKLVKGAMFGLAATFAGSAAANASPDANQKAAEQFFGQSQPTAEQQINVDGMTGPDDGFTGDDGEEVTFIGGDPDDEPKITPVAGDSLVFENTSSVDSDTLAVLMDLEKRTSSDTLLSVDSGKDLSPEQKEAAIKYVEAMGLPGDVEVTLISYTSTYNEKTGKSDFDPKEDKRLAQLRKSTEKELKDRKYDVHTLTGVSAHERGLKIICVPSVGAIKRALEKKLAGLQAQLDAQRNQVGIDLTIINNQINELNIKIGEINKDDGKKEGGGLLKWIYKRPWLLGLIPLGKLVIDAVKGDGEKGHEVVVPGSVDQVK